MEVDVLEVQQFIPSVHKSTKQFGFSFANNAPKVWNELPDDIHSARSFWKKLKAYIFTTHPMFLSYFLIVSMVLIPFCDCGL